MWCSKLSKLYWGRETSGSGNQWLEESYGQPIFPSESSDAKKKVR